MSGKILKKICKCENCGNEAEMVITCSLEEVEEETQPPLETQPPRPAEKHQVKGHGVCSHCGNEADMWVDLEP
jgi:hypothetical protein